MIFIKRCINVSTKLKILLELSLRLFSVIEVSCERFEENLKNIKFIVVVLLINSRELHFMKNVLDF